MSFASPVWLLALLLVPLALAAWWARRRRAPRYAVRFTAVPALREAAASAGGGVAAWRSYLPMALLLGSLAAVVFSLARPQRTVAVPIERATIMLVTDHSRSMEADDVAPDRLSAAQKAARTFLDQLPKQVRVGIVAFSTAPDAVQTPTNDHEAVRRIIDAQYPDGATATGDALAIALSAINIGLGDKANAKHHPPAAIVLLSDGKTTTGRPPVTVAEEAGRRKIPIYTVALGTSEGVVTAPGFGGYIPVPPDPETLAQIAQASHGRAFSTGDAERLKSIYKRLGSQLGTRKRKRESTAFFAAGALVLLLAAAATSVRFSPALP